MSRSPPQEFPRPEGRAGRLRRIVLKDAPAMGLVLFLFVACDPGDVVLLAPETSSPPPTFSVRAVVDTPWAALADSLGWTNRVPGAEVRIHRMDEPYDGYWHSATADSTGVATFGALLPGLYEVEVSRILSAAEIEQVDSAARLFAGGRRLSLPATGPPTVTMEPDYRGSLVVSEFGTAWSKTFGDDPTYFEVYNNADTTVYLDGKLWAIGWEYDYDYGYSPCALTAPLRDDPQGIWTRFVPRFPGHGTDHPLPPGATALVAKGATDHSAVYPWQPDLSHADFEWPVRANNPDVPNLQDIGPSLLGYHEPGEGVSFLSDSVDLATLPRYVDPHSGDAYVRIPRGAVIDAWATWVDWTKANYVSNTPCSEVANPAFERLPGPTYAIYGVDDPDNGLSVQRRVLRVLPDGRKVLLDTNTSMFDFVKAVRTPGWIPDP